MRVVRRLLGLALFVGALVVGWAFAHRNPDAVSVDLLFTKPPGQPLWLVLLAAFGAGALCAGALGLYHAARLRLTARRYRRAAAGLEAEIHQLRNLPLAAQPGAVSGVVALEHVDQNG
ncbi:MAG TPA: LapA family protein [Myxococcota bacterium]|nr:LapA family protein [Myxococcota bacterium]